MTVLPMRLPIATTVATVCASVDLARITSRSGILSTGVKKCIPTTFSGRCAASAMRPIGIDEVLEAKMTAGASRSTSLRVVCFTPRSSKTASITTSQLLNPE